MIVAMISACRSEVDIFCHATDDIASSLGLRVKSNMLWLLSVFYFSAWVGIEKDLPPSIKMEKFFDEYFLAAAVDCIRGSNGQLRDQELDGIAAFMLKEVVPVIADDMASFVSLAKDSVPVERKFANIVAMILAKNDILLVEKSWPVLKVSCRRIATASRASADYFA